MSPNSHTSRFALFPQAVPAEEQGRRPVIRRYALTRLTPAPARETRFEDHTPSRD